MQGLIDPWVTDCLIGVGPVNNITPKFRADKQDMIRTISRDVSMSQSRSNLVLDFPGDSVNKT